MSSKAYELLQKVKDLTYISSTSRDTVLLSRLNLAEWRLYTSEFHWRGLEQYTTLLTDNELMTLDVAPPFAWDVGNTITGVTSHATCVISEVLSPTTYNVTGRSGVFTLGEFLTNGTLSAHQGALFPTFIHNAFGIVPSSVGVIYTIRQISSSPYQKLWFLGVPKFHEFIPQPTLYAYNKPTHYTWWGEKLWFYPIPDASYTLNIFHYARPVGMKIYTDGTATLASKTLTGTSTFWLNNANITSVMYFAFQADVLSDGTYPWSQVSTITANNTILLADPYLGSSTSGTYVLSSASIFPQDFDLALIYQAAIWENMRNKDAAPSVQMMKQEYQEAFQGLLRTQRAYPDMVIEAGRFMTEPFILGDDAAKFPFIAGNPMQ